MAKQVIILERQGPGSFRVALWAPVPAERQRFYVNAAAVSAFKDATQAETDAIRAGQVAEKVDILSVSGAPNQATLDAAAERAFADWNRDVQNDNPWARYGTFFDPTAGGWNRRTVAVITPPVDK